MRTNRWLDREPGSGSSGTRIDSGNGLGRWIFKKSKILIINLGCGLGSMNNQVVDFFGLFDVRWAVGVASGDPGFDEGVELPTKGNDISSLGLV